MLETPWTVPSWKIQAKQHVIITALVSCVYVEELLASFVHVYRASQYLVLQASSSLIPFLGTSSLCLLFPSTYFNLLLYKERNIFFPDVSFFVPMRMICEQDSASIKTEYKNIHTDPEEINKESLISFSLPLREDGVFCLLRKCVGWGWILGCAHLAIPQRLLLLWRAWFIISRQWVRDKASENRRTGEQQ